MNAENPGQRQTLHAALVIGIVACLAHLWGSWQPGLWYDEFVTVTAAQRDLVDLLALVEHVDAVHAVYYGAMHVWLDVAPYTPLTLRLPSTLAVATTSGLLVVIGRMMWSLRAGVMAGLVFMALPRSLWMSTQGRSYAVAALLVTLMVLCFVIAMRRDRPRSWLVYACVTFLATVSFIFSTLIVPVLALTVLASRADRDRRHFAISTLGAILAASPVIALAVGQRRQVSWIDPTSIKSALLSPYYAYLDGANQLPVVIAWAALLLVSSVMIVRTSVLDAQRDSSGFPATGRGAVLAIAWAVLPLSLLLAAGSIVDVYSPTYAGVFAPGVALLVAGGLSAWLHTPLRMAIAIVVLLVLGVGPWWFFRQPDSKSPVLAVVDAIEDEARSSSAIWFVPGGLWDPRQLKYGYPREFEHLNDVGLDKSHTESATFFGSSRSLADSREKWNSAHRLIAVASPHTDDLPLSDTQQLSQAGFAVTRRQTVGEWTVVTFERS